MNPSHCEALLAAVEPIFPWSWTKTVPHVCVCVHNQFHSCCSLLHGFLGDAAAGPTRSRRAMESFFSIYIYRSFGVAVAPSVGIYGTIYIIYEANAPEFGCCSDCSAVPALQINHPDWGCIFGLSSDPQPARDDREQLNIIWHRSLEPMTKGLDGFRR